MIPTRLLLLSAADCNEVTSEWSQGLGANPCGCLHVYFFGCLIFLLNSVEVEGFVKSPRRLRSKHSAVFNVFVENQQIFDNDHGGRL